LRKSVTLAVVVVLEVVVAVVAEGTVVVEEETAVAVAVVLLLAVAGRCAIISSSSFLGLLASGCNANDSLLNHCTTCNAQRTTHNAQRTTHNVSWSVGNRAQQYDVAGGSRGVTYAAAILVGSLLHGTNVADRLIERFDHLMQVSKRIGKVDCTNWQRLADLFDNTPFGFIGKYYASNQRASQRERERERERENECVCMCGNNKDCIKTH
jgi:hypothetical protein